MTYTAPAVAVETIVGTTAVQVASVPAVNGSGSMYNAGQKPIYWGTTSGVTALTGTLMHPGADYAITLASGTNYYAVAAADKSRVLSVVFESNVPGGGVAEVTDGTNAATGNVELTGAGGITVAVTPGANGTATITNTAPASTSIATKTETSAYAFVSGDAGTEVDYNSASAGTFSVNTGVFPSGVVSVISCRQLGAGALTIGGTATVAGLNGLITAGQNALITVSINGNTVFVDGAAT
jgi:hypothetical protein